MLFFILLANVYLHYNLLNYRPFSDEGSFCAIGYFITQGLSPYQDFFNEKTPLLFYLNALLFHLFGPSLETARLLIMLISCLTILFIFRFQKALVKSNLPLVPALLFLFWNPMIQGNTNSTEPILALIFPVSLFLLFSHYYERPANLKIMASSFLLGTGFLFKQAAIYLIILAFIFMLIKELLDRPPKSSPDIFLSLSSFLSGLFLPFLVVLLFFYLRGIEQDFLNTAFSFNLLDLQRQYYYKWITLKDILYLAPLFILALTGLILAYLEGSKSDRDRMHLLITWILGSLLFAFPRFEYNRILPALPLISIFAGYSFRILFEKRFPVPGRTFLGIVLLACLGAQIFAWSGFYHRNLGEDQFAGIREVSRYLKENTGGKDTIYAFPHEANIYFFSRRAPASKYYFYLPWIATPEVTEELISDLKRNRPKYIAYVWEANHAGWPYDPRQYARELLEYVESKYEIEKEFPDKTVIYKLRPSTAS